MSDAPSPFASRTLGRHLLRGLVGGVAFVIAMPLFFLGEGWPAMTGAAVFGVISAVALRGCPLCWTVGLLEMGVRGWRGRGAAPPCGACGFKDPGGR
jgi:hypothetical protein